MKWEEINTALGQATYLMAIIAHRFGYKFEAHKINLCGAMSTIQLKYPDKSNPQTNHKYELYYGVPGVTEERFNKALCMLLDCLRCLMQDVQLKMQNQLSATDRASKSLLYKIEQDKIGGQTIKYSSSETGKWTGSMKYFLTNLQWLVYMSQLKDMADQQTNVNMDDLNITKDSTEEQKKAAR